MVCGRGAGAKSMAVQWAFSKEMGQAGEFLTAPLRFRVVVFFTSLLKSPHPFLWLNAAENWTVWQSRGGCFP